MSKINIKITGREFLMGAIKIALAVGAVLAFNKWFPSEYIPKDFIFKAAVYMLIYILVALVVESVFKKFPPKG